MVEREATLAKASDGDDDAFLLSRVDRENQADDDFIVTDERGTPFTGFIDEAEDARETFFDVWNEAEKEAARQSNQQQNASQQQNNASGVRTRAEEFAASAAERARQADAGKAVDAIDKATGGVLKPSEQRTQQRQPQQRQPQQRQPQQRQPQQRQRQQQQPQQQELDVLSSVDDDVLGLFE
jgi:FtsZ-interacting cell division protein ZipA